MDLRRHANQLVSIALCTYNGEKNLELQLDTLVHQTYQNKEIIIVDDCSHDSTLQIIDCYRQQHPFIKLYRNEKNLGYVKNFEKAISLCTGNYIALADQDDIWDLNKIALMMENVGNAALIFHDSFFIDQEGKPLHKRVSDVIPVYEGTLPHYFILNNCVSGHSLLFDRKLVKDLIPFDVEFFHDRTISIVACERGGIKYLDLPLVSYRQHPGSITDILDLRKTKEPEKVFNKTMYAWIRLCMDKSIFHKEYFRSILSCFDENLRITKRLRLFLLLAARRNVIFYHHKKSSLSNLNYIRKICFLRKHST